MIWVYLKFIKLFIKLFKSIILRINFFWIFNLYKNLLNIYIYTNLLKIYNLYKKYTFNKYIWYFVELKQNFINQYLFFFSLVILT